MQLCVSLSKVVFNLIQTHERWQNQTASNKTLTPPFPAEPEKMCIQYVTKFVGHLAVWLDSSNGIIMGHIVQQTIDCSNVIYLDEPAGEKLTCWVIYVHMAVQYRGIS